MYKTSTRKFDIYESQGTTIDGTNRIGYYGVRKFDRAEDHYFAKTLDETIDHYMNSVGRNRDRIQILSFFVTILCIRMRKI